jgi:glycosyltransferase involved in cell wall biosynthesis
VQVVPDFTIFGRSLVLSATMRRIERDLREKGINIFVLDQPSGLADLVKIAHMTPEMLAQSLIYWGNDVREIGKDRPPWFQAFKRAVTAEVANKVKGHLGETNGVLESLRTIGVEEGKLHKIKPPMGFPDGELTYEVRRRFLQDNEGGVLFPIRLAKEKNVGVLPQYLESLSNALSAQVSDTNPKRVCVTIVGPEQDREILALVQGLEKQYDGKGNVRFQYKGTLPPNEMWQAYRTHAVTIMPAKSEGFGRGTIEALYYGSVPIVNKECPASCERRWLRYPLADG